MSYTALYRKFRPQEFEDVKGQDHIVTTLKNQIKADRIGHAYLFCGTRGTGKTTVAKIFAKAVNCEHPVDGSPCGECPSCKGIAAGTSMNVIEIDAASNNGVDNIRQIREEVAYRPTEGKYKVYIIDEVHMLSTGAFNALLKTLEEPPAYVIFILATTEAHKIPITILSRCQRYDFHRISIDTITNRLTELMAEEQVDVEERALRYVAKAGDGSMRDALSLLDQCIAFHLGEKLTYENVLDVLGAVDTEVFSRLLREIIQRDVTGAIHVVGELVDEGRELGQLVNDFTWYMRNLLLLQSSDEMEEVLDMSADNLAALREEAQMVEPEVLMRYIRIFSELSNQIKYAAQKRIVLEVAIIKLCRPQMETDYSSLVDRLDDLEKDPDKISVQGHAMTEAASDDWDGEALGNSCSGSDTIVTYTAKNLVRDNLIPEVKYMLSSLMFPLFYIGLVFLCVALTVLSVQQLSDSVKYKFRYRVLSQIGYSRREIRRMIFKQLAGYYLCPACVALAISGLVCVYTGGKFDFYTGVQAAPATYFLISSVLFFGIYLVYFIITYIGFCRNVEEQG